jgi:hypothetical protein
MERYTHPLRPQFGPEGKFSGVNKKQEAAMGGGRGARCAPVLHVNEPKKKMRAAHGRARAAKTH